MLVDSLFGNRFYDLTFPTGNPPVALLFGENGSGKTTLLRLAYSLLYPTPTAQKRNLFRIPFSFVGLELTNGARYSVSKDEPHNDRVILFSFSSPTGPARELQLILQDGKVHARASDQELVDFTTAFREQREDLYLLSYTRKLETTTRLLGDPYLERTRLRRLGYDIDPASDKADPDSELLLAIGRLHTQMQSQARRASNAGNSQANEIYARIIRDLARAQRGDFSESNTIPLLRSRIVEQSELRNAYANSGLTEPQKDLSLLNILANVSPGNEDAVAEVTSAYVRTEDARLKALGRVHAQITEFVDALNSFFTRKRAIFDLASGLRFVDNQERQLDFRSLSSGEKQLLLLLSTVYAVDDQPSIFFIDEPELSLNADWQRLLMRNLLLSVHDKPVQFVIATHSLEILAQNSAQTLKLDSIENAESLRLQARNFIADEPTLNLG